MNRLTPDDCAPIRLADVVPGRDYALLEIHRPGTVSGRDNPPTYLRRVHVEKVEDGYATVTAREHIATAPAGATGMGGHPLPHRSVSAGEMFRVRFLGKPWDDVGVKVDAERTIHRLRMDGIVRISQAVPSVAERRLGATDVDVQGMLDLLDDYERLQAVTLDLHHRLEDERERADTAMARVDELEDELSVLGQLDRAQAMIEGRTA